MQLLRPTLLRIAAIAGRSPELLHEGAAIGRKWLDDRSAAASSVASMALVAAATEGDASVFDRMVAEVRKAPDRRDRRRIYEALGRFSDPVLERRALALAVDPALDARETVNVMWSALRNRRTREVAWEFFEKNFDTLLTRLPREYAPVLPHAGNVFCDAAHREEVRAFFEPRIGKIEGGERPLAQSLESVGQCDALAPAEKSGVARFLQSR
jgi:alanyl aminopeptidase